MANTQPHPSTTQGLCAMCSEFGKFNCASCTGIRYCSRECEKNDWPTHKIICKTLIYFSEAQRPGTEYKRAIRFPKNCQRPHFFWLRYATGYSPHYNGTGKIVHVPHLTPLLGAQEDEPYRVDFEIFNSKILRRPLENYFEISGTLCEAGRQDDIPVDRINTSLLKIYRELQSVWYGEIVAHGTRLVNDVPVDSFDLGPLEFRYAIDLLNLEYDRVQQNGEKLFEGPSVQGSRVANISDIKQGGRQPLEEVRVSAPRCASISDIDTPICDRIGIPLTLRRLPLALTGRDRPSGSSYEKNGMNATLRFLNPSLSMMDERHGVGSAITVRKDGKRLYNAHMVAITEYARDVSVGHARGGGWLRFDSWGEVDLSFCTEEHFKAWYEAWIKRREWEGKVDLDVPSPWDV